MTVTRSRTRTRTRQLPSIRRFSYSKVEKRTLRSRTQGQLLLASTFSPTDDFGNLRKDLSEDRYPEILCYHRNFNNNNKIPNGSLVVSLGEIIFLTNINQYLLQVVSPLGFVGFVNVKFLYEIDQTILESFSSQ